MGTRFETESFGKTCDFNNQNSSFEKYHPFQRKKKKKTPNNSNYDAICDIQPSSTIQNPIHKIPTVYLIISSQFTPNFPK
jgi:hypothetical protein